MDHTIAPSLPADPGDEDLQPRRPPFAARRRVLLLLVVLVVVGVAILANYGPVRAYRDARARLEQATTAVSALEQQKTQLQSELGKLSEAGYLESLAREELSYTRPGEELYIVTGTATDGTASDGTSDEAAADTDAATDAAGAGEGSSAPGSTTDAGDRPGLFERALNAILGLF